MTTIYQTAYARIDVEQRDKLGRIGQPYLLYTVYKARIGSVTGVFDSSYGYTADQLSLARARVDYLTHGRSDTGLALVWAKAPHPRTAAECDPAYRAVSGTSAREHDSSPPSEGEKIAQRLASILTERRAFYGKLQHRLSEAQRNVRLARDGSHWQSPPSIATAQLRLSLVRTEIETELERDRNCTILAVLNRN